ncbi:MAG: hypothetical protein ACYCZS_11585 [Thiobacillus sp.]
MCAISAGNGGKLGERTRAELDARQAREGEFSDAHNDFTTTETPNGSEFADALSAQSMGRIAGHVAVIAIIAATAAKPIFASRLKTLGILVSARSALFDMPVKC